MAKVRNEGFCVTFFNMCVWISFQIKGVFFAFFKISTFLWRVCRFGFKDQLLNSIFEIRRKIYFGVSILGLNILSLKWFLQSLKKLKPTKSYPHQSRGRIANFKVDQNSWPGYGNAIFVLRLELCPYGVSFKLRALFYVFQK